MEFPRIPPRRKTGSETFKVSGGDLGSSLLDFWRWSASDLLSNATRGRLAEFIVGTAVGAAVDQVRDEWSAYDLFTQDAVKIEVKSSAYIQSWLQTKLSSSRYLRREDGILRRTCRIRRLADKPTSMYSRF